MERGRSRRQVTLPISPGEYIDLRYSHPLTEGEWAQMLAVLEAMKPGIVDGE